MCSNSNLTKYEPFSFMLEDDRSGVFRCGWSMGAVAIRAVTVVFTVLFDLLAVWLMVIIKGQKGMALLIIFLVVLLAAVMGYFTGTDLVTMISSYSWCKGGLDGLPFVSKPKSVTCVYDWFFISKASECVLILLTIVLAYTTFRLRKAGDHLDSRKPRENRRRKKSQHPFENEDDADESTPINASGYHNFVEDSERRSPLRRQ